MRISRAILLVAALLSVGCAIPDVPQYAEYCGVEADDLPAPSPGCRRPLQTTGGDPSAGASSSAADYEVCDGDRWNRSGGGSCELCYEMPRCIDPGDGHCGSDLDCASGEVCAALGDFGCECRRTCSLDDDCGQGDACLCPASDPDSNGWTATSYPQCLPADCRSNDDCESGECGVAFGECGFVIGLRCRNAADECAADGDCASATGSSCFYDVSEMRYVCGNTAECP